MPAPILRWNRIRRSIAQTLISVSDHFDPDLMDASISGQARSIESAPLEGNTCRPVELDGGASFPPAMARLLAPPVHPTAGPFAMGFMTRGFESHARPIGERRNQIGLRSKKRAFDWVERSYTGGVVSRRFCREAKRCGMGSDKAGSSRWLVCNARTQLVRDLFGLESKFERRNVRPKNFGGSAPRRFDRPALWSPRVRAVGRNELVSRLERVRSRNHGLHLLSRVRLNSGSGKLFGVPHGRSRFTNSVSTRAASGKVCRPGARPVAALLGYSPLAASKPISRPNSARV